MTLNEQVSFHSRIISTDSMFHSKVQPVTSVTIEQVINLSAYPIQDLAAPWGVQLVQQCRDQLAKQGYCILRNFITPSALTVIQAECAALAPLSHHTVRYTNPYKTQDDPSLSPDHPLRSFALRTNAFIAQTQFDADSLLLNLYHSDRFKQWIAACFNLAIVYEYADALGGLVLNLLPPTAEHPWHFDENDFSVILLVRAAEQGGELEVASYIRSAEAENFDQVAQVLQGNSPRVQQIDLAPGDLCLFCGKYSLHRVTQVIGLVERQTVIFSYTQHPGVIGRVENNLQIFAPQGTSALSREF
jgi:hypothetical protein